LREQECSLAEKYLEGIDNKKMPRLPILKIESGTNPNNRNTTDLMQKR
jgi:hypothetical protein